MLQLVLQRGRSYDEIAQLLSIDRAAVRQRALDAFDALTPATVLPGPEQALVTDYLLGQLPEKVAEQVYSFLQASDADRAWALAIVGVITPLVSHSLPEIPVGGIDPARPADDLGAGGLERDSDSLAATAPFPPEDEPYGSDESVPSAPAAEALLPPVATATWQDPEFEFSGEDRPSSRRGGAILLVIVAVLIAAAVVIAVATSGGPAKHPASAANTTTAGQTTHTGTTGKTSTTARDDPSDPRSGESDVADRRQFDAWDRAGRARRWRHRHRDRRAGRASQYLTQCLRRLALQLTLESQVRRLCAEPRGQERKARH